MSIIGEIRKKNNLKMRYLKYFFLIFIIVWLTLTDFSFNRILISEILASFLYSVAFLQFPGHGHPPAIGFHAA